MTSNLRRTLRLATLLVLVVLLIQGARAGRAFYLTAADYGGSGAHPQILQHPAQTGIAGLASVSFAGLSGETIRGWYVPSRNGAAIVAIGGSGADRSQVLPETRALAAAGFGVLAFDWPGTGLSDGRVNWGRGARAAMAAAVDWVSHRSDVQGEKIGVFGFSAGGMVSVQTAVHEPRIACLVLAGTPPGSGEVPKWLHASAHPLHELPAEWAKRFYGWPIGRERPLDLIAAIAPRPVMIIGGSRDPNADAVLAQQLFDAAREPKTLWVIPDAGHTEYQQKAGPAYLQRVTAFFERALLPSAVGPTDAR